MKTQQEIKEAAIKIAAKEGSDVVYSSILNDYCKQVVICGNYILVAVIGDWHGITFGMRLNAFDLNGKRTPEKDGVLSEDAESIVFRKLNDRILVEDSTEIKL